MISATRAFALRPSLAPARTSQVWCSSRTRALLVGEAQAVAALVEILHAREQLAVEHDRRLVRGELRRDLALDLSAARRWCAAPARLKNTPATRLERAPAALERDDGVGERRPRGLRARFRRSPPCGLSAPRRMPVRNAQARSRRRAAARTASTIWRAADCRARTGSPWRATAWPSAGLLWLLPPPRRLAPRVSSPPIGDALRSSRRLLFVSAARSLQQTGKSAPKRHQTQKMGRWGNRPIMLWD